MYFLTHVIPISRSPISTLSYFHNELLPTGTLVRIPLGKKEGLGVVSGAESVGNQKLLLRKYGVVLKKIKSVEDLRLLDTRKLDSIDYASKYFLTTPGALISQFFDVQLPSFSAQINISSKQYFESQSLHGITADRISFYKTLIRESLAKKESITFLFPSKKEEDFFASALSLGIEHRVVIMNADTRKKYTDQIEKLESVVYFTTPQFFLNMPNNVRTCVVERASNDYSRIHATDVRVQTFVKFFAEIMMMKIIFADDLMTVENFQQIKERSLVPIFSSSLSLPYSFNIIDMKKNVGVGNDFSFLSNELKSAMRKTFSKTGKVLLVVNRTGYAPITTCRDCGSLVRCSSCNNSLTLFSESSNSRIFFCRQCDIKFSSDARCNNCGSWRLLALGIGTEKVAELVRQLFPETKIDIFDSSNIKTNSQIVNLVKELDGAGARVIIATEMFLHYSSHIFDIVGIVSLDSMLSIPHFSIQEKVAYLAVRFGALSKETPILQTRLASEPVFTALGKKHLGDLYREELSSRKQFGYPPYTTIIELRTKSRTIKKEQLILASNKLDKWSPVNLKNSIMLKIPSGNWPDEELSAVLGELSGLFYITVEAERTT